MPVNTVVRSLKIPLSQADELEQVVQQTGLAKNHILKLALSDFLRKIREEGDGNLLKM